MRILGIHDGHNASVCLLEDGKIKWVLQEERLRKEKNFDGFPEKSIQKILQIENLDTSDIDKILLNGYHQPKPMNRIERLNAFKNLSNSKNKLKSKLKKIKLVNDIYQEINNKTRINNLVKLGFKEKQIDFVEHHEAHAASAYFGNGVYDEDILVFTNDGAGDRICATVNIGKNGKIKRLSETHENHSIGILYAMFTFLTGMVPLEHEYKLMGMAPYADKKGVRKVANEFWDMFEFSNDGLSWKFKKGESIYQSLDFFKEFMYLKRFDHLMGGLQLFVEEFLSQWVKNSIKKTGIKKIACSGGTFMNVKANKVLMELDEVEKIFVFPSCGDESNAIGVAYKYFADNVDCRKIEKLEDVYFGIEWEDDEIYKRFEKYNFKYKYEIKKYENIEKEVAHLLAEGNVVARFKGREEFGARSLGNRAILANPSKDEVVKEINEMIKNRDFWMPFASSILDEDMDRYIAWEKVKNKNKPYYMIMTYDTKIEAHKELKGGIHPYDKTVRPQMVTKKHNEDYLNLIKEFKNLTGIGGLLNTSLNLHGLPLVHEPEDAFNVLENSNLKYLAIGNYIVEKL